MTYGFEEANFDMKACFYIPFIVAPLSCASSIYVVYLLTGKKNRLRLRTSARDQLLLGMSALDILASFGLSFSTLPGPEESLNKDVKIDFPRYGNIQTCEAQAFFVHMGSGVPWYNAAICIHYVLTIRYNISDRKILKWLVPISHSLIIVWTVSTGAAGLVLEVFNFAGILGCWIGTADDLCQANEIYCDRGEAKELFEQVFVVIPMALAMTVVIICMLMVYLTVRRIEANSNRWNFAARAASNEVSVSVRTTESRSDDCDEEVLASNMRQTRPASLTRRTMWSCLLYSGAFLLVYLPIGVSTVIPPDASPTVRRMIRVLSAFFFPLQGFFNLLIYTSSQWVPATKERWNRLRLRCRGIIPPCVSDSGSLPQSTNESMVHTPTSLGETSLACLSSTALKEVGFSECKSSETKEQCCDPKSLPTGGLTSQEKNMPPLNRSQLDSISSLSST